MWAALPLLCAGAWLLSVGATAELTVNGIEKLHFKSWMKQHQKTYSSEEYNHRLQTFANNWKKMNAQKQCFLIKQLSVVSLKQKCDCYYWYY